MSGDGAATSPPSLSAPSGRELTRAIKALALTVGFDVAGVAPAKATAETRFLREWLARGYAGRMRYLTRRVEERVDPRRVLEGARSLLVVGLAYDPGKRFTPPVDGSDETRRS